MEDPQALGIKQTRKHFQRLTSDPLGCLYQYNLIHVVFFNHHEENGVSFWMMINSYCKSGSQTNISEYDVGLPGLHIGHDPMSYFVFRFLTSKKTDVSWDDLSLSWWNLCFFNGNSWLLRWSYKHSGVTLISPGYKGRCPWAFFFCHLAAAFSNQGHVGFYDPKNAWTFPIIEVHRHFMWQFFV